MQQDVRKKRTGKRLSVTNVTRLSLACFVRNPLNIDVFCSPTKRSVKRYVKFGGRFFQTKLTLMFSGLLQKDLCKGKLSLAKSYFKQTYCHACHTRIAAFFPFPFCCVSSLLHSTGGEHVSRNCVWDVCFNSQLNYTLYCIIVYCMLYIV